MNETIDIDHLVATITTGIYGDDRMSWDTIEAATTALSQLVAEVERLRGERTAEDERADVVAWLNYARSYDAIASARFIASGGHVGWSKGEKP